MEFLLSEDELKELRKIQKKFTTQRSRYIKATVLIMLHRQVSIPTIEDFLGIDDNSIYRYVKAYRQLGLEDYMKDNYKPYSGKLSEEQEKLLDAHLRGTCYPNTQSICAHIQQTFGVQYTRTGMVPLLHRLGYEYKQTKVVPGKADEDQQVAFLEETLPQILAEVQGGQAEAYFADAAHPTHNTVSSRGWIKKGADFEIAGNSGRKRLNINAAINATDPTKLVYDTPQTVDASSTRRICQKLLGKHKRKTIYLICDNARYNHNKELNEWAAGKRIKLIFLPTYSPNLNLIERLWRFLRQHIINSTYYERFDEFKQEIVLFLNNLNLYKEELKSLLTLNFRTVGGTSFYSQTS